MQLAVALFVTYLIGNSLVNAADNSGAVTPNPHDASLDNSTSSSPPFLTKRGYSRLMNQCTGPNMQGLGGPYTVYTGSYCQSHISSTAVAVSCKPPHDDLLVAHSYQSCAEHEICIDRVSGNAWRAFCVGVQNFVEIAEGQLVELGHKIPRNSGTGRPVTAEAALVAQVGGASIKAQRLELVAYGRRAVGGHASILRELRKGRAGCEDCYTVKLEPLPPGTAEVRVKALAEGARKGYLYVATLT